jgi:hypothetical protein
VSTQAGDRREALAPEIMLENFFGSNNPIQILALVYNGDYKVYEDIKALASLKFGRLTQFIRNKNVTKALPEQFICVANQLNMKLGGLNWTVQV